MAFWSRPQTESGSPHPIGGIPDDLDLALSEIESARQRQRHAELEHAGASVKEIVACYPDATLYLLEIPRPGLGRRPELRAMTGWRWLLPSGCVEVIYESGFRESPSEWATHRAEGAVLATGDTV